MARRHVNTRPWTREELRQFVIDYPDMQMDALMEKYQRSYRALVCKAFDMQVSKSEDYRLAIGRACHLRAIGPRRSRVNKKWSGDIISALLVEYPDTPNRILAQKYGCSERAVRCAANDAGIKKSKAYRSVIGRAAALQNKNRGAL